MSCKDSYAGPLVGVALQIESQFALKTTKSCICREGSCVSRSAGAGPDGSPPREHIRTQVARRG